MKRYVRIGLALLVAGWLASSALAFLRPPVQAPLTGTWTGRTLNGIPLRLELESDGVALEGTLTRNRRTSPITDGRVTEDGFTFRALLGRQVESFTGTLRGEDRLRLKIDGLAGLLTAATFTRDVDPRD